LGFAIGAEVAIVNTGILPEQQILMKVTRGIMSAETTILQPPGFKEEESVLLARTCCNA